MVVTWWIVAFLRNDMVLVVHSVDSLPPQGAVLYRFVGYQYRYIGLLPHSVCHSVCLGGVVHTLHLTVGEY